ncbi:MAG: GHMP kinase [Acidobacteria bacterium]|nr:GHMP kinase [Acidobacteriota bacterium]
MFTLTHGSTEGFPDSSAFLAWLNQLPPAWQSFFTAERELFITRAPGRLDLMGGIADYSGALVLQLPISVATHVALQRRNDRRVRIVSLAVESGAPARSFEMGLEEFGTAAAPLDYATACERFKRKPEMQWAAYIAGVFLVLLRERGIEFAEGANLLIRSRLPEGKGISSSAALEVAAMQAVAAAYELDLEPSAGAFLCQIVENRVAGAPCGVMDQMASQEPVKLPAGLAVWGIDSGIRHAVGGSDYGTVRTAAFMGYRILAMLAELECEATDTPGKVRIVDPRWHGYLANLSASEFEQQFAPYLPQRISGADFLAQYQGITDPVTTVDPARSYPVAAATRHPIYENERVNLFAELLRHWQDESQARLLGELMYASHASYSACGLGSEGTDELVRLVREAGPAQGLFGAKITGGGSGGAVAILGRPEAETVVEAIAATYAQHTGREPLGLRGSSPGAAQFGYLRLKKE